MVDFEASEVRRDLDRAMQSNPICFRVRFDSKVPERAMNFHGTGMFQCPSELVIPLKMPLHVATLRDLWADFSFRVTSRHPELSQSCTVDAFFVYADSTVLSRSEPNMDCGPFLRLDVEVNADDTLNCFFAPRDPISDGAAPCPTAYDVIAHWCPKPSDTAAPLPIEEDDNTAVDPSLYLSIPQPVVFPSAWRDVYVKFPPSIVPAAMRCASEAAHAASGPIAARVAAFTDAMERRRVACAARRALQSQERAARADVSSDEAAERAALAEVECGDRRQVVRLLRLMDIAAPSCGVAPPTVWARGFRRVMDSQPLVDFPTALPRADLAARAEWTAWLSTLFAAKGKGARGGEGPTLNDEMAEELLAHYAEVRCDLLAWERLTFRELTATMRKMISALRVRAAETADEALREELALTDVLGFECYSAHYDRAPVLLGGLPTPQRPVVPAVILPIHLSHKEEEEEKEKEEETQPTRLGGEVVTALDNAIVAKPLVLFEETRCRSPQSYMEDDEEFRRHILESKARAVAALEKIRTIDARPRDPVALRIAKHQLCKRELESRNTICLQEANELQGMIDSLQRKILEYEDKALRAYMDLISPVLVEEEQEREKIAEMEDRRVTLYVSLHIRGAQRFEAPCRKEDAAATDTAIVSPEGHSPMQP